MTYNEEIIAKDLIKEIRELRKTYEKFEENKQRPVASVNIPLDEYNEMRDKIEELKRENEELNEALKEREDSIGVLLSKLDIPFEQLVIDTGSVYCEKCEDPMTYRTIYTIRFNADQVRR